MKNTALLLLALSLPLVSAAQPTLQRAATAEASPERFVQSDGQVANELIVRLKPMAGMEPLLRYANSSHPGSVEYAREVAASLNIHLLRFDPERWQAEKLREWMLAQSTVEAVQHNYRVAFRRVPNDPEYELQWGINRIGAPQVWEAATGGVTALGDTIVVAVVDSGFDLEHEDLQGNIWNNPHEIPADSVDNDGNGYVDDVHGWDFVGGSPDISYGDHGLSVSGIIGASGNNERGVTGLNWNVKMMLLSVAYVDQIISSYEYVIEQRRLYNESGGAEGAFIVATNASFGLPDPIFCEEQPLWGEMYDLLGEVGVLTGAGTANDNFDVDELGDMPTTCKSDYILTVLNANEEEEKHSSSAYGSVSIDMAAPGEGSQTLKPGNSYGSFGGNSAAAPHITGAIALLYSLPCPLLAEEALSNPAETALWIRSVLLQGVDLQPGFAGITATGGRLNVQNAMDRIAEDCGGTSGPLGVLRLYPNPASEQLTIEYETPDNEAYEFRIYNTLGQVVYRNSDKPDRFGTKTLGVDVSKWPQGLYVLSIRRGEEVESQPFLVAWP